MWDSNGDSSKLLKICIFHKPITALDANHERSRVKTRDLGLNVGILTFKPVYYLLLNPSVGGFLSVRTAPVDILCHGQVPGNRSAG